MGISNFTHNDPTHTKSTLEIMQSSTPSIRKSSLSPKTFELGMHPQETNWNEPHVHKQR